MAIVSMRALSGTAVVLNQERWFVSSPNLGALRAVERFTFRRSLGLSSNETSSAEYVYEDVSVLPPDSWIVGQRPKPDKATINTWLGYGTPVFGDGNGAVCKLYISAAMVGSALQRIFWSIDSAEASQQPLGFIIKDDEKFEATTLPSSGLGYYDGGFPT